MARIATLYQPAYLYRYRSLSTREQLDQEVRAISDGYLWCSDFESLNDPMEGSYEASVHLRAIEQFPEIRSAIYGYKQALGVCSFSETNDHDLMWAHYADQFRGICIEYDLTKLLAALPNNCNFVRVSYLEKRIVLTEEGISSRDVAKTILSTKSNRWLYEKEWRLLSTSCGRQHLERDDCVSRIYTGRRIDPDQRDRLLHRLGRLGIPNARMHIDGYSISFDLEPARRRDRSGDARRS